MKIEEKAKAYDEAIEKSKEFYILCKKCGAKDTVDFLEEIFPELKESEDEKIRKVIRGWIYTRPDSFFDSGISKENMIAWLEKQDKQNPNDKYTFKSIEIKLGREWHRLVPCEGNGCAACSLYAMCYVMKACGRQLCDAAYLETTEWKDNQNHRFELLTK